MTQPEKPRNVSADEPAITPDPIERTLRPIARKDFGYEQARHLLWRAGFGGDEGQIRWLADIGPEKAVDALLAVEKVPADAVKEDQFDRDIIRPPSEEERQMVRRAQQSQDEDALARARLERQRREREDRLQMGEIQKWWLRRMIETPRPLEEKMTLFWHGLLATNFRTIENSYHMFRQNQLFRSQALGSYAELMTGLIRDPAMIAYLDNNDSRKNRPNENLAREIMELFSLGIGNYTEADIKQGARALTGYTFEDDEFRFQKNNHDTGVKTILGQTGTWTGDDFVRIILEQPACSKYITRRLYSFFVADVPPDERGGDVGLDPAQRAVLRQLADSFRTGRYQVRPLLRRLFLSEHFYEPRFMNDQIKSPIMLVVGAIRSLKTPVRDLSILNDACDLMGQRIFFPPSVKGWDGGRSWINTSTYFVRQNILAFLLTGKKPQGYDATADSQRYDALALLAPFGSEGAVGTREPAAVADALLRLTLGWTPKEPRDVLTQFAAARGNTIDNDTVTGMLLLITTMPEYQLC
jgi:uncharacterized protein (DUF1800 family)